MKVFVIFIELGFIDNEFDMVKWNVDKIVNFVVFVFIG